MDDGFQNPSLAKDLSILVVDGARGIGNARVLPAGPLRAPLETQLDRAHAILIVGEVAGASPLVIAARARKLPLFHGRLEPDRAALAALSGTKVLAFAGIGDPEKFFATLARAGIEVPIRRGFADHHRYRAEEAAALIEDAERNGLSLLTTEKDLARMQGDAALAQLVARTRALPVSLAVAESADFGKLSAGRARSRRTARLVLHPPRRVALQHRFGRRIGLLQFHIPVFQLFQRDRHVGDGAAHESAGPNHAEVPVEIFHLRLTGHRRRSAKAVQHVQSPFRPFAALCVRSGAATQNIMVRAAALNPAICAPQAPVSMRHPAALILAALLSTALPGAAGAAPPAPEQVEIAVDGIKLKAFLYRPEGNGPFPAVVALHNCDGLAGRRTHFARRYRDWGERLVAAGFVALFPDSFGSRGLGPQCSAGQRRVRSGARACGRCGCGAPLAAAAGLSWQRSAYR